MAKPAVLLTPRFHASLKPLSDADISRVESVLALVPDCFGKPHAHTGISIRCLKRNIFECRVGLKIRLLFCVNKGALEFFFAGNHDEVRRALRTL